MKLQDPKDKPRCPKCNRTITGSGTKVQGVLFGPTCCEVVYRRARIREGFGSGIRELRKCEATGDEFYARQDSDKICPPVKCASCRYNTRPFQSVELCPLEVEAKQRELDKWK